MNTHAMQWAFDQDLNAELKLILVFLCSKATHDGVIPHIMRSQLVRLTGRADSTVARNLRTLEQHGYLGRMTTGWTLPTRSK